MPPVPNQLHLINTFEQLKEHFVTLHSEYYLAEPKLSSLKQNHAMARMIVVEAWIQSVEGEIALTPPQHRRLRSIACELLGKPIPGGYERKIEHEAILKKGSEMIDALNCAEAEGLEPLASIPIVLRPEHEAELWRQILPEMTILTSWRLMARLGRAVVVPELAIIRLMWRMGLIEKILPHNESIEPPEHIFETSCRIQAIAYDIAEITGLSIQTLNLLLHWVTGQLKALHGGRWCRKKTNCHASRTTFSLSGIEEVSCPLRQACTWARFHPTQLPQEIPYEGTLEQVKKDLIDGHTERIRPHELIALLIQAKKKNTIALAELIIRKFHDIRGIEEASIAELTAIKGFKQKQAIKLKAALELGRCAVTQFLHSGDGFTCSEDVWKAFGARYRHLPQEHFVVILLNTKNRVIGDYIVSKGNLINTAAHPREVFKEAVRHSAASVILLHNHPSGDPTPSKEDVDITEQLVAAGKIMGIKVWDHIILGANYYVSFKDDDYPFPV